MVVKQVVKLNTGAEMPVLGFGASETIEHSHFITINGLLLISYLWMVRNLAIFHKRGYKRSEGRLRSRVQAH